jgi:hypothetical protein
MHVFLLSLEQEMFLLTIGENGDDNRGSPIASLNDCIWKSKQLQQK